MNLQLTEWQMRKLQRGRVIRMPSGDLAKVIGFDNRTNTLQVQPLPSGSAGMPAFESPDWQDPQQPQYFTTTTAAPATVAESLLSRWPIEHTVLDGDVIREGYRYGEAGLFRLLRLRGANMAVFQEHQAPDVDAALKSNDRNRKIIAADAIAGYLSGLVEAANVAMGDAQQEASEGFLSLAQVFSEIVSEFERYPGSNVPAATIDHAVKYANDWRLVAEKAGERYADMAKVWADVSTEIERRSADERALRRAAQQMTEAELEEALTKVRTLQRELDKRRQIFEGLSDKFTATVEAGRDVARSALERLKKSIPSALLGGGVAAGVLGLGALLVLFIAKK